MPKSLCCIRKKKLIYQEKSRTMKEVKLIKTMQKILLHIFKKHQHIYSFFCTKVPVFRTKNKKRRRCFCHFLLINSY